MALRNYGAVLTLAIVVAGCSKSTADWTTQAKSGNPAERLHAVRALQEKANEPDAVVPVLTSALKDEDPSVRRSAAKALGRFGPEARGAVAPLAALLKDREPSVRKAAAASLKAIDPAAAGKAGVR